MTLTEQIAAAVKPILDAHMQEARERIATLERNAATLVADANRQELIDDLNKQLDEAHAENARLVLEREAALAAWEQVSATNPQAGAVARYSIATDVREVVEDDLVVVRLTRYTAIDTRNRTAYLSADRRDVVGKLVQVNS